jgi:hypothetical protein
VRKAIAGTHPTPKPKSFGPGFLRTVP